VEFWPSFFDRLRVKKWRVCDGLRLFGGSVLLHVLCEFGLLALGVGIVVVMAKGCWGYGVKMGVI
jgi:hypothetical protein